MLLETARRMKYAIVQSGSRQLRAEEGAVVAVDRLPQAEGGKVKFSAMLLSEDDAVLVGTPLLEDVAVKGTVVGHARGSKIRVFKYKPKKRYRRTQGHRQEITCVMIDKIIS